MDRPEGEMGDNHRTCCRPIVCYLYSPFHPAYKKLKLPQDAPFILGPSPGKGWGAFATRKINSGDLILKEDPTFVIRTTSKLVSPDDTWAKLQHISTKEKEALIELCVTFPPSIRDIINTFSLNQHSFVNDNGEYMYGLYPLQSRFNNTCVPNSRILDHDVDANQNLTTRVAIKDILPEEEITFMYKNDFTYSTRAERHAELGFVCKCHACNLEGAAQQLSDMRRRLARGLLFLFTHDGPHFDRRISDPSAVIAEPILRRAAQRSAIPISNRFVYMILTAYLLEQEGLLDEVTLARYALAIHQVATWFRTASNRWVAVRALSKQSWHERVVVAFRIFRRADAADGERAERMRAAPGLIH
jgi:hypothetical protein